jgi:hypothetical protein
MRMSAWVITAVVTTAAMVPWDASGSPDEVVGRVPYGDDQYALV